MPNIPIFLASDNNYAPFVASTIASICDNTKSFIDFYILDGGITKENQDKIWELKTQFTNFSIEFLEIDIEKEFKSIEYKNNSTWVSLSTYNRFLIPRLKPELAKVLYLDVDIVVLSDITHLYNQNLDGYALGAAWHETRYDFETTTKDLMDLSDEHKYFNAGILLLDNQKWKKKNILESLFEIEKKYKEKVKHADETLLNKYFDNNYKIFDIKYNYMDFDLQKNKDIQPVIRHFATKNKPWLYKPCDLAEKLLPYHAKFWHYLKLTEFYDALYEKVNIKEQDEILAKLYRHLKLEELIRKNKNAKNICNNTSI